MKEDKSKRTLGIVASIAFAIIAIPIFIILMLYALNINFLDSNATIMDSILRWSKEIPILTAGMYGVVFIYAGQFMYMKKPKKSTKLASQKWETEAELKSNFASAPIDPFARIDVGGIPIHKLNEDTILYDKDVNQDLTIGSTRSGKTRKILVILIFLCAMARESILCNDPKKELYKMFKKFLTKLGYKVYCLDYRFLQYSDCKNPMDRVINFLKVDEDEDEADQAAQDLVETLVVDNGQGEKIWIDGQKAMAKATILAVAGANISEKKKNFYAVYQTLNIRGGEHAFNGDPKNKKMELTAYMEYLEETNIARTAFAPIRNAPERTRGSFMTSTMSTMQLFGSRKLNKAIGRSDFQYKDFATDKIALFIVNPDEKSTYDKIASIQYDQSYQEFVEIANKNGGRVPRRIHNIFDEAGNMAVIKDLDKKLTVSLGRGILYHLFIQSYAQLDKLYKSEGKKTIVDNCITKFFISSGDYETCDDISKRVGEETIWVDSQTGSYSNNANPSGGNIQYSQQKRRLIDANELLTADFRSGQGIVLTKTYCNPAQVYLPDFSKYDKFAKELEDPETFVEKENDDRELLYAVPRWIIITSEELKGESSQSSQSSAFNPGMFRSQGQGNSDTAPNQKCMYWYWSMRTDLGDAVKKHLLKKISESNYSLSRDDLKEYLNSPEFLKFIDPLDVVKENKNDDKPDTKKSQKKDKNNESTLLEELMEA